ncbi:BREX system Lon protease-like protein BrxL [Candidatus Atribacteria bacterium HGW-Atribacteria-1]|nr:MAG: BREX system Lon protease-like protein BrxL [Candidatus Atribacteria bacterium HGW-Atribacteria-1]
MLSFEQKAKDYYGEIVINKGLFRQAGFGSRALPAYVGEWILSHYMADQEELTTEIRNNVAKFVAKYLPAKGQKEEWKNRLLNQEPVNLLDHYTVSINLKTGQRHLNSPFFDIKDAYITEHLVDDNEFLLTSGVWGVGELFYIPPDTEKGKGQVWMRDFKPFQIARIDLDYFIECRQYFSIEEWIDLLVSSMGFSPVVNDDYQKMLLLTRMLPLVEPRINLVELAPKGTGKSFVFDHLSRYARVIGGGKVTPAALFHNNQSHEPGLVTRYDVVVLDEVQSVRGDSAGEVSAMLKVYLESGKFSRGKTEATAESGFVMLANISLDERRIPIHLEKGIFKEFPNFLQETAFIDRLHGIIPGWYLPRVSQETPSIYLGFKGDLFAEILHSLRKDLKYVDYVNVKMHLSGCDDLRDKKAITRTATAYLKLLFPNLEVSNEEFIKYCVKPAIELRQKIRDELWKMDREYEKVDIKVKENIE